jgi:tetratricopeptide (TPR) repeat protein
VALKKLHQNFTGSERVQSLNGLGGIGKTQTAVEYAYRHRQLYKAVLWAGANTRETLVADYVAIAGLLDLPEKNAQGQGEAVAAVKRWLENNSNWLLILDNADEIEIVDEFIPSCEAGHVLLTTRAHAMGAVGGSNELEKMTPKEGALFLLRRLRKVKKDEALESATAEIRAQAEALSTLVDGLPLAIDQAAAFIEEKPSTFEEYQNLYQSERKELLRRRGKLAKDHPSVTVTFSLAFQKVADDDPVAADLLRVCAFLEADSISEEIFSKGAKELGEALSSIAGSHLGLSDSIEEAARFSLLRRHPEARTLSLHRLAQAVLRDEMDDDARRVWAERAVRAVNEVFPVVKYPNWPSCDRLIRHAQALAPLIDDYGFDFPEAARLLYRAGDYLDERAQYEEAEPLYVRALAIREKALGAEHPYVAKSLNNLALLYDNQGKYAEAEPLFVRALAIREKVLRAEHPDVANSLYCFAWHHGQQKKYAEAEPLYQRALSIYENTLGPEHPLVVSLLGHYASSLRAMNKNAEAENLEARVSAVRKRNSQDDT